MPCFTHTVIGAIFSMDYLRRSPRITKNLRFVKKMLLNNAKTMYVLTFLVPLVDLCCMRWSMSERHRVV